MRGKFYGIGVGVGDPEMLTLKAVNTLKKLDVVVLPEAKKDEGSTAYSIAKEYIRGDVEKLFLEFPMISDIEKKRVIRKENAMKIEEEIKLGKNVGFLTIGDPMTFSTYTYVLEYLDSEIEVETIPGITSFHSIASRLNIPLVIGDENLKIISLSKQTDIRREIENSDNLVFMKISRNFKKIKEIIYETGNRDNVVVVSDCGKESEKIYYNLDTVEEIPYFSTLILKKGGIKHV